MVDGLGQRVRGGRQILAEIGCSCYTRRAAGEMSKEEKGGSDEMPRKLRQLRAELRRAGCYIYSQKGSHERWTHPLDPTYRTTLSGHDGDDAQPINKKMYVRCYSISQKYDEGDNSDE
jgi:predicted RNA binding protein YcfA (HicA-like mRNA interferase family)